MVFYVAKLAFSLFLRKLHSLSVEEEMHGNVEPESWSHLSKELSQKVPQERGGENAPQPLNSI